jgi:hypothetical protein
MKYGYLPEMRENGFTGQPSPRFPHIIWFETFNEVSRYCTPVATNYDYVRKDIQEWLHRIVERRTDTYHIGLTSYNYQSEWIRNHRFNNQDRVGGPLERGYISFREKEHAMLFKLTFA